MGIAERIRIKRKALRLSQAELAELLGLSYMTVRRWETKRAAPNTSLLPKLAEVLDTSVGYLIGDDDTNGTQDNRKVAEKGIPGMAYWGEVIDNAKNVAINGNNEDIFDVSQMLKKALSYFPTVVEAVGVMPVMSNMVLIS